MRLKVGSTCASLLGAALIINGCGGDSAAPAPIVDDFDGGPFMLPDGGGRRDGGGDAGQLLGPDVTVLAPLPAEDPSSADVLTGSSVKVRCSANKSKVSEVVDPASVKVALYPGEKTTAFVTQLAKSTAEPGVFEAELSLADAPHGQIRIECQASDVADKPQQTTASVTTLYDKGPQITFLNPMQGGFVAAGKGLGEDVRVRFRVTPQLLANDDPGAALKEVSVTVGGKPFTALQTNENPGEYSFGLDFSDTTFFMVVPATLSVKVTAGTERRPLVDGVSATLTAGVDSEGPRIAVIAPARVNDRDAVVSGKVDVLLEVTDALAGVNPSSVQIETLNNAGTGNDVYKAEPVAGAPNRYATTFETGSYPDRPTLAFTVKASDKAGNVQEASVNNSLSVDVDTVAPWISLDPPLIREKSEQSDLMKCTGPYDPVGADAVNNNGVVTGRGYYVPRVIIWDRPLAGARVNRHAMIRDNSARLHIQYNNVPLLVDTDGDLPHKYCDSINTRPAGGEPAPTTLTLSPLTSTGTPPPAIVVANGQAVLDQNNRAIVDLSSAPSGLEDEPLCQTTIDFNKAVPDPIPGEPEITRIVRHEVFGIHPVVYAYNPAKPGEPGAAGKEIFVSTEQRGRWQCVAASAFDNAGNFGFSEPIQVCVDSTPGSCAAAPKHACTDGCTIPDHFLRAPTGAIKGMPRVVYFRN